ncbi:MAG: AbrB/MazE/SpoVT family DNA-binding domain-containing protein [Acidobacteria bacterium]|nr:AbrB/MazE/SpoVT family DNA-binding domain-containing protein [Acidobacteriota bacterium]MBV9474524.1 AbrB/MazE/SpoVT family DNA-binding domain-containing protein [Acidobacteriota bacterium]
MARAQSKLTAQSEIAVPAEIRRKLGIGPGSIVEWEQDGELVFVRRAGRYSFEDVHRALFGGQPPEKSVDVKATIAKHIRAKHARR